MLELILEVLKTYASQVVTLCVGGLTSYYINKFKVKADNAEVARIAAEEAIEKRNEAIKLGLQAILRDRIIELHDRLVERGYVTVSDLDKAENLSKPYFALDGNGIVVDIMNELHDLPIRNAGGKHEKSA